MSSRNSSEAAEKFKEAKKSTDNISKYKPKRTETQIVEQNKVFPRAPSAEIL